MVTDTALMEIVKIIYRSDIESDDKKMEDIEKIVLKWNAEKFWNYPRRENPPSDLTINLK